METRKIITLIITFLLYLIGGWDNLIIVLLIFMAADYLTGFCAAWWQNRLNSKIGLKGIIKKLLILIIVVVADKVDLLLNAHSVLRNLVIYFLIANEGLSILENMGYMGIKIPKVLLKALEQLNTKEGIGENSAVNKRFNNHNK